MRTLSQCPLFEEYGKTPGSEQVKTTLAAMKNRSEFRVKPEDFKIQLLGIEKFKYPLKDIVLNAVALNKIILTHAEKASYMPMAGTFPYLLSRDADATRCYVHLTPLASRVERLSSQRVYGLLESALISLTLTKADAWSQFKNSSSGLANGARVYSDLIFRLLDSKHMVGIRKEDTDKSLYVLNRFYLQFICSVSDEIAADLAASILRFKTSRSEIEVVDSYIKPDSFDSFKNAVRLLSVAVPTLASANHYSVITDWTKRYGESTLFAVEYLPYFIYMLISAERKTNLVNTKSIVNGVNLKFYNDYILHLEKITREAY
jgi:hypothetical protein